MSFLKLICQFFHYKIWNFALVAELQAVYANKKIKISSELYKRGCVNTWEEGLISAQKIGFPVMIKASEGGGGKGIRKVEGPEDFANLFRQVSNIFSHYYIKYSLLWRP